MRLIFSLTLALAACGGEGEGEQRHVWNCTLDADRSANPDTHPTCATAEEIGGLEGQASWSCEATAEGCECPGDLWYGCDCDDADSPDDSCIR